VGSDLSFVERRAAMAMALMGLAQSRSTACK
jgi:hypothetical protein